MEKKMKRKGIICSFGTVICALILLQFGSPVRAYSAEQFPDAKFTLPAPDSVQAQKYLGLNEMEPFGLSDIKATLVVVEFMSALCPHCHTNAPIVNNLYKTIQGDSHLADVKVIAIAVGNEKAEVEAYKKKFKVDFPVLLDEDCAVSASMGGIATPTTMIISTENGKVLYTNVGVIQDTDCFLRQLKSLHKKK
jgi:peroxiredoxin